MTSPMVRMMDYQNGVRLGYLLSELADLNVADQVADGPLPVAEIADRVGAHPEMLHRALRAVASRGVFTEVAPGVFGQTEMSETLRSDVDGSLRDVFRMQGMPFIRDVFAGIGHTVRTGEPAFDHVHGTDLPTYLAAHPDHARLFAGAMGSAIGHVHQAALDAHDLSSVRRLVDVGGADGRFLAAALTRHPRLTGVVFDVPAVVERAAKTLADAGVADRAELVGGDYFTAVPPGGDAYLLSHVVNQIPDPDAVRVLRTVCDAVAPDGRVILVDPVLPDGDVPHPGKFMDITAMALTRGRGRTEREIVALLAEAGLRHTATIATAAPSSVVLAVPA
ncbi:MAG TPA: methyltransferase [Pseudonocardiaceae bacterium]|nr:methyltransferase [Pseudonocardiaceae bacterium]